MDRDEAISVLSRYRPGETDQGDLRMAEALAMVQKDAKLTAWFKKYCKEQPWLRPPAAVIPPENPVVEEKKEAPAANRKYLVALALMLLAIIAWRFLPVSHPNYIHDYRDRMARMVQRAYPMKIPATVQKDAANYFAANGVEAGWSVPAGMENFPAQGAAVFTWNNQRVALLGLKPPQEQAVYLFIASKRAFDDPPPAGTNIFEGVARFSTFTWLDGKFVYLLAGPDERVLRSYVK